MAKNYGDVITLRGDRNLWIDFVAKVKDQKKSVGAGLEAFQIFHKC